MNQKEIEIYECCQLIADSINHATKVLNPLELCFFMVGLEHCLPSAVFCDYIKNNLHPENEDLS